MWTIIGDVISALLLGLFVLKTMESFAAMAQYIKGDTAAIYPSTWMWPGIWIFLFFLSTQLY